MAESRGTLVIRSRLHGDIRVELQETAIVGRSTASDIVIGDSSLAPKHLGFELDDDTSLVQLKALDGDIVMDDGERLAAGDSRTLLKSTGFRAGDVPFHVQLHTDIGGRVEASKTRRMMPLVLAAALLGSTALATTEGSSLPRQATQIAGMSSPLMAVPGEPANGELPLHARASAELRRLEMENVTLDLLGDGAIQASGTLFEAQAARWADFKKWLDAQSGGNLVLVDAVTPADKTPRLTIQSAWLGDTPYVIDGQGDKLFVGAIIENGWVIRSIEPGRLNVRRGRQELAIRF